MVEFNSQRIQRAISAQVSQTFASHSGKSVTNGAREAARCDMMGLLRQLQEAGDIPDDVNVCATRVVTHDIDPCSMDVQIPILLRLYLQDGYESARTPRFVHEGECCKFLGHGLGCDLYWCGERSLAQPTVIARHSSLPEEYQSGLLMAMALDITEPLALALALAREAGLVTGQPRSWGREA